jgi:hypothetical protein
MGCLRFVAAEGWLPSTNCIKLRRGESCRVVCRNGWYFVGTHTCSCSGNTCTLAGAR